MRRPSGADGGPGDRRLSPARLAVGIVSLALVGGFAASFLTRGLRTEDPTSDGLSIADYRARATEDGGPAPGFSLPALNGDRTIALGHFSGRVLVLNFWASWCAPCREEAPSLVRLSNEYRARGVRFLGVNHQDNRAAGLEYERGFRIPYRSVFDPAGEVALGYGLLGLPSTIVIDGNGLIAFRFTGIVTEALLRESLEEVLAAGPEDGSSNSTEG